MVSMHILMYEAKQTSGGGKMNDRTILCVFGDARQAYTAGSLSKFSNVYTYGITNAVGNAVILENLDAMEGKADVLLLPMMSSDGLEIGVFHGKKIYCSELVPYLKKNALVTGGRLSIKQIEYFSALGFDVADYFKREELVIKNCIPTAEGALQIAMQELATTINGLDVLVIGYGRVGKAAARLFQSCGALTTVTARRTAQLAEAENNGLLSFDIRELFPRITRFGLIVNTVPSMILTSEMLEAVGKDSLIIDLASKPGGVDFESAKELNKRVVWALGLPGKVAPITSGEIIADAVKNIIVERSMKNVT